MHSSTECDMACTILNVHDFNLIILKEKISRLTLTAPRMSLALTKMFDISIALTGPD